MPSRAVLRWMNSDTIYNNSVSDYWFLSLNPVPELFRKKKNSASIALDRSEEYGDTTHCRSKLIEFHQL
jgi:hypothetical protein